MEDQVKEEGKKQLKTSFSMGSLGHNNGGSMVIEGGHSFGNNSSKLSNSMIKYGQKSRYSQARPAGLPGRTYHCMGYLVDCTTYWESHGTSLFACKVFLNST